MITPLELLEKELRSLETLMTLKFHHKHKREAKPLIPLYKDAIAELKNKETRIATAGMDYCVMCRMELEKIKQ